MKLFDSTKIPLLQKALNAYSLRQKVSSENIANINTAGYRAQAVSFKEEMQEATRQASVALSGTDKNHFTAGSDESPSEVVDAASAGLIADDPSASGVNNVDIDHEMAEIAETQLRYKYAARLMTETFREIQSSIRGQS